MKLDLRHLCSQFYLYHFYCAKLQSLLFWIIPTVLPSAQGEGCTQIVSLGEDPNLKFRVLLNAIIKLNYRPYLHFKYKQDLYLK